MDAQTSDLARLWLADRLAPVTRPQKPSKPKPRAERYYQQVTRRRGETSGLRSGLV